MSLTPEIITLLLLDSIFLFFGVVALVLSVQIALKWDYEASTPLQYRLSKRSVLVALMIKYIFLLKLPLFLFFIYTCDKLSNIIAGAMCASGVVNSVDFGFYLMLFKLLNLYVFGFWLVLHAYDKERENLPFTKLKFMLFALFALPLLAELSLEIAFFSGLNISKIVSCCGTLFSTSSTSFISLLLMVDERLWVGLFYLCFALIFIGFFLKNAAVMFSANSFFLLFALMSLIAFFSTYVYELPTHRCPFCLLQKEYYYVGYVLYIFLFAGTFYGTSGAVLELLTKQSQYAYYRRSLVFNGLYVMMISFYPVSYFLKNGVWL